MTAGNRKLPNHSCIPATLIIKNNTIDPFPSVIENRRYKNFAVACCMYKNAATIRSNPKANSASIV